MPEWAELQRNTGQRGLLIASYKRLKKDSDRAITPVCVRGGPCPCTLGTARVPSIQAVTPPSCSTLTGAELPQVKKKGLGRVQLFATLCGLPGFSVREKGSPGKNTGAYWPILVAIPF